MEGCDYVKKIMVCKKIFLWYEKKNSGMKCVYHCRFYVNLRNYENMLRQQRRNDSVYKTNVSTLSNKTVAYEHNKFHTSCWNISSLSNVVSCVPIVLMHKLFHVLLTRYSVWQNDVTYVESSVTFSTLRRLQKTHFLWLPSESELTRASPVHVSLVTTSTLFCMCVREGGYHTRPHDRPPTLAQRFLLFRR